MIEYLGHKLEWIPVIDKTQKPIYLSIVKSIENDIEKGILTHGQKLPPQRLVANYLGISHGTVTRAYKDCEIKGILKAVTGKGTFVNNSIGLPASILTASHEDYTISLGMSTPLYECNKYIKECVKKVSESIDYDVAFKFSPPEGHKKHRYIISEWLRQYNIKASFENILITAGTQNALSVILMSVFNKGDRIITDELTYTGLKSIATYMGIILVAVEGDENGMYENELEKTLNRENIQGIYLIPDNHNPFSTILSEEKRRNIAKIIEKHKILLIEDATFSFLHKGETTPIREYIPDNTFYIHSTSKAINTNFRVAYLVSPKKYVSHLAEAISNLIFFTSPYIVETICLLHETKLYDKIAEYQLTLLKKKNKIFDDVFKDYKTIKSSNGMFRYVYLSDNVDSDLIEKLCLDKGVQVFAIKRFSVSSNHKYNGIRVSISAAKNDSDLHTGLTIVKDILKKL